MTFTKLFHYNINAKKPKTKPAIQTHCYHIDRIQNLPPFYAYTDDNKVI